jgi:hypothetical protein
MPWVIEDDVAEKIEEVLRRAPAEWGFTSDDFDMQRDYVKKTETKDAAGNWRVVNYTPLEEDDE